MYVPKTTFTSIVMEAICRSKKSSNVELQYVFKLFGGRNTGSFLVGHEAGTAKQQRQRAILSRQPQ